jgi:hypothetical protein
MKIFAFLVALAIVGLVVTGAIKLQKSDSTISIEIDRQRVKQDASIVVEGSRKVLREAGEVLEEARDKSDDRR